MSRHTLLIVSLYLFAGVVAARAGEFQTHVDYPTGDTPNGIAIADFNGDGKFDLVTANTSFFGVDVSILLGNGDGTFQSHVDYAIGHGSLSVAVGDFNGDGKLDLVLANYGSNTVSVMLGNGDGTFQSHVDYQTANFPGPVAVGDFNRDGAVDLVTGNWDYYKGVGTVSVLLGNGDGTFQGHQDYATITNYGLAVGDFNGDGKADLVTGNDAAYTVSVLLGNGDGTFQDHVEYETDNVFSVAAGDFNDDGKLDLVTWNCCFDVSSVSVLLGNGDGTFRAHVDYAGAGGNAIKVAVADLNGDRKLDLVTSGVNVFLGNGDGTLRTRVDYEVAGYEGRGVSVAVGDLNQDGAPDLAVASGTYSGSLSVLLNTGGTFVTTTSSPNPSRLGQPVTFTTTVTASLQGVGTPTGTVTFKDGTITLGTAPLISGQASLTTSKLNTGNHKIGARYSGGSSSTFNPHEAVPIIQRVRR